MTENKREKTELKLDACMYACIAYVCMHVYECMHVTCDCAAAGREALQQRRQWRRCFEEGLK